MASTAYLTTGTTISVGGTTVTQITDFSTPSDTISEVDITNMSSAGKEFLPGLPDGGECSFTHIIGAEGAITSSDDIVACTMAVAGVGSFGFNAYVKAAPVKGGVDGVSTQDVSLRVTAD
jgi:hypothetical protein